VPRPSSTPASPGRRPCQATIAAPAIATANRSQLVKACTITSGDSATMAASQRRRPASRNVLQVTTSMHSDSSSAVTVKYACTSGTPSGSLSAIAAETPMKAPVSTGYSTAWSTYGTAPLSRCSVK
jgi:hypothetical protein